MFNLSLPLSGDFIVFAIAATAIGVAGVKLASYADRLADRTGLGEAVTGTIVLGLITALPGLAASVTAALQGHAVLAISNAMGGIAFQTTVLAVADIAHRKANLEHAAASATNMMQTIMLILLMTLVLMGLTILLNVVLLSGLIYRQKYGPGNIGFESVLMLGLYIGGFVTLSMMS